MNGLKLLRRIRHLKIITHVYKNWDHYTKDNTGFYANKVRIVDINFDRTLTKEELANHIARVKLHCAQDIA